MRSRLLPLALLASALASPGLAAADEPAPPSAAGAGRQPSSPPPPAVSPLGPMRAALEAAAVERKPVSAPLVVAGGVVAGVGGAGALAGLFLMSLPSSCYGLSCAQRDAGRVALSVGAPVLAAGLVMVIIGIQPAPDADKAPEPRLLPEVSLGPTGGALRWTF